MSEDPETTTPDTDSELTAALGLEGFEDAIKMPAPAPVSEGEPEQAEAADESEAEEKPEVEESETPKEESDEATEDTEAKPEISFDEFPDAIKATWEELYKDGKVTPEQVNEARGGYLRTADYTRKTMALADKGRAFEAEMAERKDDIELLDKIRASEHLHDKWLRMASEPDEADGSDDDLVDRKAAREEMQRELDRRESEQRKTQEVRETRINGIREMAHATIAQLGIDKDQMVAYLDAENATIPADADPIMYFTPEELQRRVTLAHEATTAKAEAAALAERLDRRAKKDARGAKQSLPPTRSAPAREGPMTPKQLVEAELGLDPDNWADLFSPGKMTPQ